MSQQGATVRILVVGEELSEFDQLAPQLREAGYKALCQRVESEGELRDFLELQEWDYVLAQQDFAALPIEQTATIIESNGNQQGLLFFCRSFDPSVISEALKYHAIDIISATEMSRLPLILARINEDNAGEALANVCEQYRSLLISIDTPVVCLDTSRPVLVNQAYCELVGQTQAEVLSHTISDNIQLVDGSNLDTLLESVNSRSKVSAIQIIKQGEIICQGAIEAKQITLAEENFLQLLFHIPKENKSAVHENATDLTLSTPDKNNNADATETRYSLPDALCSESELISLLEERIQGLRDSDDTVGFAHIKMDNYFKLKKTCGPQHWPRINNEFAHLVIDMLPESYQVAKFSDSAYILLADEDPPEEAKQKLENIAISIAEHNFKAGDTRVPMTISIGIDKVSNLSQNANSVLSHAETACAVAAERGGNQVNLHDAEGTEVNLKRDAAKIENLRQALAQDRFKLLYQPIASLHAEPKEFYQVLIRLQSEDGSELLLPQTFLEIATRGNLMPEIDRWVVINAIERLKKEKEENENLSFFVLQGGDVLRDPNYVNWIQSELKDSPKLANSLLFEYTVKDVAQNLRFAMTTFKKIRALGCKVVLSRFNKNRESEICIKHAQFDMMKIDGSLLHRLNEHKAHQECIQELVQLAESKNIVTVAPYVEDANSLATLWRYNIGYTQGYFLQEPSDQLNYDFGELM